MFILFAVECKCLKKIKATVENLIHVALILEFWLVLCQGFLIRVITKVLLTDNSRIPENIHIRVALERPKQWELRTDLTWRLDLEGEGWPRYIFDQPDKLFTLCPPSYLSPMGSTSPFKTIVLFWNENDKTDETAVKFTGKLFRNSQTEPNLL